MRSLVSILAIAALAPLASASFDLSVSVTSAYRLENTLVAYHSSSPFDEGAALLGSFDPGTYTYNVTIPGDRSDYQGYRYTLAATYLDPNGTEGVVVGLSPDAAQAAQGQPFSAVFPGAMTETALVGLIEGTAGGDWMDAIQLRGFFLDHLSVLPQGETGGSLVGFSNGHTVGHVDAAPVPEPAPLIALGLGSLAMRRRSRRAR